MPVVKFCDEAVKSFSQVLQFFGLVAFKFRRFVMPTQPSYNAPAPDAAITGVSDSG
jgi:hypothetical protein